MTDYLDLLPEDKHKALMQDEYYADYVDFISMIEDSEGDIEN